jgi:hypothetical protein
MTDDIEQILRDCLDGKLSDLIFLSSFLVCLGAQSPCHFIIVDGLDDMDATEQRMLCEALRYICEKPGQNFKVMLSGRHHAPSGLRGNGVELFEYVSPQPLVKKDIEAYIDFALTTKVENQDLSTDNPELIGLIAKTLLDGAEEM